MKKALNIFLLLLFLLMVGNHKFISAPESQELAAVMAVTNISSLHNLEGQAEGQLEGAGQTIAGVAAEVERASLLLDDIGPEEGEKTESIFALSIGQEEENPESGEGIADTLAMTGEGIDNIGPVTVEVTEERAGKSQAVSLAKKESLLEKIQVHKVEKGESLWTIAAKYGIDIDTLIGANDIADMNRIRIGDSLRILPVKGILYRVNPGENLWTIARQFNISVDKIVEANAIENPELVQPGTSLILPGAKPEFGYKDRLAKQFIYPVEGRISSYFGPRWGRQHEGIDFAVNVGTQVKAARAGRVVYSQWANGYGYTVVIEHQKGIRTLYAHNSKLLVRGGQWVEQGQVISLSGNTGNSTGPHLHFEIQINGQPVNPLNYIRK